MAKSITLEVSGYKVLISDKECEIQDQSGGSVVIHPTRFEPILGLLIDLHSMVDFPDQGLTYPPTIEDGVVIIKFIDDDDLTLSMRGQQDPGLVFSWANRGKLSELIAQSEAMVTSRRSIPTHSR